MLYLIFHIGNARFALSARSVTEVLPLVSLKPALQAPTGVAGFLNYRGQALPVIDLTLLTLGHSAAALISTRLWIVDCPSHTADCPARCVALLVEKATQATVFDPALFRDPGLAVASAGYLGALAADAAGMTQILELPALLGKSMLDALFPRTEADLVA